MLLLNYSMEKANTTRWGRGMVGEGMLELRSYINSPSLYCLLHTQSNCNLCVKSCIEIFLFYTLWYRAQITTLQSLKWCASLISRFLRKYSLNLQHSVPWSQGLYLLIKIYINKSKDFKLPGAFQQFKAQAVWNYYKLTSHNLIIKCFFKSQICKFIIYLCTLK